MDFEDYARDCMALQHADISKNIKVEVIERPPTKKTTGAGQILTS